MRYTSRIKPHSCPIHDKGPLWELQLVKVNTQLSSVAEIHADYRRLQQSQRELRTKVARYHRHLQQYSKCRDAIKAVEATLQCGDGRCVLYRDFVNCYNERGTKVNHTFHVSKRFTTNQLSGPNGKSLWFLCSSVAITLSIDATGLA